MRTNVCLTLPNDLAAWLDRYAEARHLPRSYAAQELLERCSRDAPDLATHRDGDAAQSQPLSSVSV